MENTKLQSTTKSPTPVVIDKAKLTLLNELEAKIDAATEDMASSLTIIAESLSTIKAGKLYQQKGDYRNVAEYAQERFGLKSAFAYSLAKAGDVLRLPDLPEPVKALPVSTIAEMGGLTAPEIAKIDTKDGRVTAKEVREQAKSLRRAKGKGKTKGTPGYTDTIITLSRGKTGTLSKTASVTIDGKGSVEFDTTGYAKVGDVYVKIDGDTIILRRKGLS